MRAVCWHGKQDVRVDHVPDPEVINPRDAVVQVRAAAICGSDLHLYDGYVPTMKSGDVLGHEFIGEVMEVGSEVKHIRPGDRVAVPFPIACGGCFFCRRELWSLCDNSNPNAGMAEKMWGHSPSGIYGYSHLVGGYAGGQAEFVRVPFADVGPVKLPDAISDEQGVMLTDVFPTGYQAAEYCDIQPGDTVAVWGCGPVGQMAIASAKMLGAERVIAIDDVPERLDMAVRRSGAEPLRPSEVGNTLRMVEALRDMTAGRGPDACIDAVGMEAHGVGLENWYDRVKQSMSMETERPTALRQAIMACRKGGVVSIPGVYGGFADKIPLGALMNKALTVKTGQTHVHRYLKPLIERIESGEIDPGFVFTHQIGLDEVPDAYRMFRDKQDGCIKVMVRPQERRLH